MTEDEAIETILDNVKERGKETEGFKYPDCDAMTFWEMRCALLEFNLDNLYRMVYEMAPAGPKEKLEEMWDEYTVMSHALPMVVDYNGNVREEYKDEPPLDAA